jgi:hypothetical protein
MHTFSDREMKLVLRLKEQPPETVLRLQDPCPLHSVCTPLPLFRVYKIDDSTFEAQWNDYHNPGTRQVFRFDQVQ